MALTYAVYCPVTGLLETEDGRQLSTQRRDRLLGEIANRRHVQSGDMDDEPSVPEGRPSVSRSALRSRLAEPALRDSDLTATEAGHLAEPSVVGPRRAELTT